MFAHITENKDIEPSKTESLANKKHLSRSDEID